MMPSASGAKKNSSDEGSSGSEAELSAEPTTDRFGFLLTNGASAESSGPHPHLVRQREGKWINIINQWETILMKKPHKVKVHCQKGIPSSLRAKCWPLLCGATERMKHSRHIYQTLDSAAACQHWVDVIERDLDRQFPFHEMFLSKDGHGQHGLFRVLKAYTQFQPDEGYCQAQGPVAAVLLMNMPEEEAFWCLVQISEQYLPGYYSPLLEGVLFDAALLTWLIKRTCPPAHKHMQRYGVEPLMFATDWLMCLFTRHLPFNTLLRVWDLFFCYGVRVLLQVAVVLVRHVLGQAEQRKQCQGQMETLERLRAVKEEVKVEEDTFIAEVCSIPLSTSDLEKQTAKELEKWQKDKPSSTFDPRGRCHGYRMVWAQTINHKEEQDRVKRETGNLSVTLIRSASTLSLSPSILERWRGGKVDSKESKSRGKIIRHFSMGAKDEWTSWRNMKFKNVKSILEEDVVMDEHQTQREKPVKLTAAYKHQRVKSKEVEPKLMVAQNPSEGTCLNPTAGDVNTKQGSEKEEAGSEPTTDESEEQMRAQLEVKAETSDPRGSEETQQRNEDKTETPLTSEIEHSPSETAAPDSQHHMSDSPAQNTEKSHNQTDLSAETQDKAGEKATAQDKPATVSLPEGAEEHDITAETSHEMKDPERDRKECEEEITTEHQEVNEENADQSESPEPLESHVALKQEEVPAEPDHHRSDAQTTQQNGSSNTRNSKRRTSSFSTGDICVRRSFTSAASREARRLNDKLFVNPQGKQPTLRQSEGVQITGSHSNMAQTPTDTSSEQHLEAARASSRPQATSVFHRLKGDKTKRKQKMKIPKITIQDFSDVAVQQKEEKLREKRRRRSRESERRRKEEKQARKMETRKQQKKSSQLQKEKESTEGVPVGKSGSPSLKHSASYAELYF
ncbi:ecotropic viral integration site 5 ortholog [Synchiropus splendidus]|uniref:ecotropic viral integration site 5 ortholog n=1 Tax=Synchiropus splendidus TaxID=270530 RepID=UPI00237DE5BF|nr:ecotropic viral integration site 5 ortholog [Synchiropus splendidus]